MAKAELINRLAVTFHVPEGDSPEGAMLLIQKAVDEIFEGSASYVPTGENLSDEIMFSIQKPLVNSPEFMEEFFKKLNRLFDISYSYLPHFTQLPEMHGGRN